MRPIQAIIDLAALRANVITARRYAPGKKLIAVVKADAYGHGAPAVAKAIADLVDIYAVSCVEEALELREAQIKLPILLLEGIFTGAELSLVQKYKLQLVVQHEFQVQLLQSSAKLKPITIWLKLDTGMGRLGFLPHNWLAAWQQLQAIDWITKPIKLMTHLACADEIDNPMTAQQIALFNNLTAGISGEKSLANSAAILAWPAAHGDWVRAGIMLYGGYAPNITQPVMQLQSELISIKNYSAGSSIGYGASWRCAQDSIIGIVAAGYADGYPRHAPSGSKILVNNQLVPLVGRVSMDMLAVDLTTQATAKIGDKVILWGKALPISTVAEAANTISYELLTRVHKRVKRINLNF